MKTIRLTYDFRTWARIKDPTPPESEYHGSVRVTVGPQHKQGPRDQYLVHRIELVFNEDDGRGAGQSVLNHAIREAAIKAIRSLPDHVDFHVTFEAAVATAAKGDDFGLAIELTLVEVRHE